MDSEVKRLAAPRLRQWPTNRRCRRSLQEAQWPRYELPTTYAHRELESRARTQPIFREPELDADGTGAQRG